MTNNTIPMDWPLKVKLAARTIKNPADRIKLAIEWVTILRRMDPMGLRDRGMDAPQRHAVYSRQVDEQLRAA